MFGSSSAFLFVLRSGQKDLLGLESADGYTMERFELKFFVGGFIETCADN